MTRTAAPAAPKLSARMAADMTDALTRESRLIYCSQQTGAALVARGYATGTLVGMRLTTNRDGSAFRREYRLTPEGVARAVELMAAATPAERTELRAAANKSAERVSRFGDDQRDQRPRTVTVTDAEGNDLMEPPTAQLSADAVRRMVAARILDGSTVTRTPDGRTITVVRTNGHTMTLTVTDPTGTTPAPAADAAPATLPGVVARLGEARPAFADDPANPERDDVRHDPEWIPPYARAEAAPGEYVLWGWTPAWPGVVAPLILARGTLRHARAERTTRDSEPGMITGIYTAGADPFGLRLQVLAALRSAGRSPLFITKTDDGYGWQVRHAADPERYLMTLISSKPAAEAWRDAMAAAHPWGQYDTRAQIGASAEAKRVAYAAQRATLTGERKTPMPAGGWDTPAVAVDVAALRRRDWEPIGRALGAVDGQGRRATYDVFETDPARGMYVRHVGYVHPDGSETGAPLGGPHSIHLRARFWTTTLTDYREHATPRKA